MAAFCDQPVEKVRIDTDRDFYMTPTEALAYGIIDEVIQHKNMIKDPKIPNLKVPPPLSIYDLGNIANDRKPPVDEKKSFLGKI